MGRIFILAEPGAGSDGAIAPEVLVEIRNLTANELRSRGFNVLEVPSSLDLTTAIAWINRLARPEDVAIALETDAFSDPSVRGTTAFFIANNLERQAQAQQLLQSLTQTLPFAIVSRGARPDTETLPGSLAFIRQLTIPALVLNLGFVTNPEDRRLLQTRQTEIAQGLANGLARWSQEVSSGGAVPPFPPINISINGQIYGEQGIIVEGNAYVPVDVIDRLGIDIAQPKNVRLLNYGNVTYIRAIDLRDAGVFVGWEAATRTVLLRAGLPFDPANIGQIIRPGYLSENDLETFLETVNPQALDRFPDIAELYLEEAAIEGVSPDVAFAQALLETNFFRFGGDLSPSQNNFGGLGAIGGSEEGATFPSARIGVRAQIQHLKAYANQEPLVQELVDPRFRFVARGVAPTVQQLSRRWSADPNYGEKILAILRRLYDSAGYL